MATAAPRQAKKRAAAPAKQPAVRPAAASPKTPEPPAELVKPRKSAADKPKRVRGAFSMPEADYARIDKLKATARRAGLKVKKNELLQSPS